MYVLTVIKLKSSCHKGIYYLMEQFDGVSYN